MHSEFLHAHDAPGGSRPPASSPRGYLVYDATGHVFFQAVRPSAMDSLRGALGRKALGSTLWPLTDAFAFAFGTFRVDTAARLMTRYPEVESPLGPGDPEVATP